MMSQQNDNRNYKMQMYKALHTQSSSAFQSMDTVDENGNETEKHKSGKIIPWRFVPPDVRFKLIKLLNPHRPLSGNDWQMLAYKMGFTAQDINFFESEKDNNTSVLFRYYDEKPGASFNDVYTFLEEMQRQDCVDVLNTAFDRIRQAFFQAQSTQSLHAAGIPAPLLTGAHNQRPYHSCPCTHGGHLTSLYGIHTDCMCGSGYTICGCVGSSHLHSHPPDHSMFPHPYQLSTYGNVPSAVMSVLDSTQLESTQLNPYQLEISQPACASVQTSHSPTYSVHKNDLKRPQTHLSGSGYAQDERYSTDILRSPVASYLSHQPSRYRHNPGSQAECLNVNATGDNTVINMNTRGHTNRQKVNRQNSEDFNVPPDFHTDKRFRNKCSSNGIETNQVGTCSSSGIETNQVGTCSSSGIETNQVGTCSSSGIETNQVGTCSSSGIETNQVGTCVAAEHVGGNIESAGCSCLPSPVNRLNGPVEGMVHLGRSLSDSKVKRNFQQGNNDRPTGMISCHSNMRPSLVGDPREAKHDQTTEASKDSQIFKMSLSMPADMKPKAFRKAQRHSKVFVTYSHDNDLHIGDVRSLCRFLLHNGFPCYVDIRNNGDSDRGSNSQNSYSQILAEVDFILVCISNKYVEDIAPERSDSPSSLTNNGLHTREIYELLNSSYLHSIHSNTDDIAQTPKVIPLLFGSMTHKQIPRWMRCGHIYKWPEGYMDLVKLLAKPEEKRG